MPTEYSAVIEVLMPYIPLQMPMRVLTSKAAQKIEYYDGVEIDVSNVRGTFKNVYKNGNNSCLFTPPAAGPRLTASRWEAKPFLPNLTQYTFVGDELVGGIMCQKFVFDAKHSADGLMDDHIAFYWNPLLKKPVRWHQHSRAVSFGSHTDEYILDFVSFQPGPPASAELEVPPLCREPSRAQVSIKIPGIVEGDYRAIHEHMISELNRKHNGRTTFRKNSFFGLTRDEIMQARGGKTRGVLRSKRRSVDHLKFVRIHKSDSVRVPEDFDWRTKSPGVVGPVKDQAYCGSCWAYGAMGPLESITAIRTGRLVELPEQFVVDCTWTNGTGASGGNFGCDGGDSDIGVLEIVRKYGGTVPSAKAYGSYLSVNGFCKDTRLMDTGAKVTGWVDIQARAEKDLLHALFTIGPLNVNIMVPDEMLYYESGVLSVESCKYNDKEIDHAVVAVGFGTDEHGTTFYTIRNSWSTYWGNRGYINIARGELDCCVSCEAGAPEVSVGALHAIVV
eukprot:TRINITY_DN3454_c0_g1_i3.p1 TRINITY_DN3454_c0_g1~~TRINITY_DN3454_c0_g1_i3.p1  ORF type:complete len:559 (+),score=73.84 TRINITY_DN3454_c0_g1_i3:170-1678(+)